MKIKDSEGRVLFETDADIIGVDIDTKQFLSIKFDGKDGIHLTGGALRHSVWREYEDKKLIPS